MTVFLTPYERYRQDLQDPEFSYDQEQEHAVQALDALYHRLIKKHDEKFGVAQRMARWFRKVLRRDNYLTPEKGLYFWGGVGRGKTYVMDMFYESLPFESKMRMHFHRFMRHVHHELTTLQGEKDPLDIVARRIANKASVVCFDEFFVSDITDAMLLAGLCESLFANGVCLVATSNIEPENLYKDGLQRQRFLPAIALIEKHTAIINIDGQVDYRLRTLEQAQLYYAPINASTEGDMMHCFHQLAPVGSREFVCIDSNVALEIEGRTICARYLADDVAWFEFAELCDGPRSQFDYIELAREFHAVLISNVRQMNAVNDDRARRFILLVDEFYDRKIKVVISSDVDIAQLYTGSRLAFEFERTQSRLLEMQSHDYLASAHRA